VRDQYSGRVALAGCTRSATFRVAVVTADVPLARVPSTSVRNCQPGSVSMAEWMPTKPPPAWK